MTNHIKELREEFHMTQVRLSIELEVAQETVSAYEKGKSYPSVATLLKLCKIFNTSCDYILGLSDDRIPPKNNELSLDERRLLTKWNLLDDRGKELLTAYLDGLTAR